MGKVVVFGATGNLGAPISIKLMQDGHKVIFFGKRE